jgi:sugar/nucleoside kinase (ribokinase family)
MRKVLGLGNALVDILIRLDNYEILREFSLPKGSMQLVDRDMARMILHRTEALEKSLSSGGSAANTIHGLARLGVQTGYIGAIGQDKFGNFFRSDLEKHHIKPYLNYRKIETGRATTLITPDSERTFATYLGAAIELKAPMLLPDYFSGYDFFHFEGYLVPDHELVLKALKNARKNEIKISIDMASYNIVEENRDFLDEIITNYVDIVFANEEEAKAFTGKDPENALCEISKKCEIAVVKIGKNGSLVRKDKENFNIGVIDVKSRDTTGAGDLYASGFLYGLIHGFPLDECGKIGAILSGKVIEVFGAKMDDQQWGKIRSSISSYYGLQF